MKIYLVFNLLFLPSLTFASPPDSSLTYQASIHSFISQQPAYSPHWFIHNRNGIFSQGENNLMALGKVNYQNEFG
ncbi:MAG: hypothetical protein ACOCUI_01950, partial [bacterium]